MTRRFGAGTAAMRERTHASSSAIRWAKLVRRFQNVKADEGGPVVYALRRAYAMNAEMTKVVESYVNARFGTDFAPFEQTPDAYERLRHGTLRSRAVVTPNG